MRLARSSLLRHLRMFCVCARSLSFKSAAQILHLTPSAISHQIRELEDQLGVQLFVRRTRALELTPVGRSLLAEVEPLLLAVEEAVARISADPERKSVNVAMPPFFASELVIPRLSSLYAANPGIAVQLDTHDAMPRDHSSGADISVIIAESPARGLESHELFPLRLVGACSLEIRARLDQLGSVALSQVPVVVHRMLPGVWDQWAAESGFAPPPPRNVIELDNMFAVTRAAERGVGVALVPSIVSQSWFQSGALARASDVEITTGEKYFVVWRAEDIGRPALSAIRDWAIAEFIHA
jgi:LysR family glycine cleavage system transcriptional activator